MTHPTWDPEQYLRYGDARLRPGFELMARIGPLPAGDLVDLGCGAGEHLIELAARYPGRRAIGIDLSEDMLAKARRTEPSITWESHDIATWRPDAPVALLFTNAALQWIDDHAALIPHLFGLVAPGGVFAAQMPFNTHSPAHALARDLCVEMGRADLISELRSGVTVLEARAYDALLRAAGGVDVDVWETTYLHPLGPAGVTDWVKGAALRPILSALDATAQAEFLAAYDSAVRRLYPPTPDGVTIFPQTRVFMAARRRAP